MDPIFKGLMLKYLIRYQEKHKSNHTFHVITFEQQSYEMGAAKSSELKQYYDDNHNIVWHPLNYHTGGFLILFKKVYDLLNAFYRVVRLKYQFKIKTIIGFTSISGVISSLISKLLGLKLILLNIEPHSDYMSDFGYWPKSSFKYRILNYYESKMYKWADHIAVPTMNAYRELEQVGLPTNLHFLPTCIELSDFMFSGEGRKRVRRSLGVTEDTKVLIYVGKFGGIYYTIEETAKTFAKIRQQSEKVFFYVITTEDVDKVEEEFSKQGLAGVSNVRGKVPYEELSEHISSADFGVMLVPSYPSQRYRCPIKTANYLACGIPYVITKDIGDDSDIALAEGVGVIINEAGEVQLKTFTERERLQEVVYKNRGIQLVTDWLEKVLL